MRIVVGTMALMAVGRWVQWGAGLDRHDARGSRLDRARRA